MNKDIFEFYFPIPTTFGDVYNKKPPMNAFGVPAYLALGATLAATAASTYISVKQSETAAEQSRMNAEAEANALKAEANRQQLEFQENQRRLAKQQREFRQKQLKSIIGSGIQSGTGTTLELEADTWSQQQRELNDREYLKNVQNDSLQYGAARALALGENQANLYKGEKTAAIVGGIGSAISTGANFYANYSDKSTVKKTTSPSPVNPASSNTILTSNK